MGQPQRELHEIAAEDGWPLALYHYAPSGPERHGEPVLLQHGLSTCSQQFDLPLPASSDSPSLARWLASKGYSVWAGDLRGGGHSSEPGTSGHKRWGWNVDDHIHQDIPAFINHILTVSDHEQLHWVGHSMGGILLLTHCVTHGSRQIASAAIAACGLDYSMSASRYDLIEPLKKVGRLIRRVPAGKASRLLAPFAGRVNNPFEASFYNPRNMCPLAARSIFRTAQYDLSGEILHQLASLFKPGGIRSADGAVQYSSRAREIDVPILFLAGERDLQCSSKVVEANRALLRGDNHKVLHFGKSWGQVEDYGHFDLFAGVRADKEVFPSILSWLKQARVR